MSNPPKLGKVGYKRPPKEHRFKPGTSGNPKGRPKKPDLSPTDLIDRLLNETTTVTIDGEQCKITKKELLVMQLINNALKGQPTALRALVRFFPEMDARQMMRDHMNTSF